MYGRQDVINILVRRDGMSRIEAAELVAECMQMVTDGDDPAEVLHNELGLEPDYIFALITEDTEPLYIRV